jgi:hypothetical protein
MKELLGIRVRAYGEEASPRNSICDRLRHVLLQAKEALSKVLHGGRAEAASRRRPVSFRS